jgi:GTP1/Obg family GTP-binding protein
MDIDKITYDTVHNANEFYKKKIYTSRDIAEDYLLKIIDATKDCHDFPPHFKRNLEKDLKELKSEYHGSLYKDLWARIKGDLHEIESHYLLKIKGLF